MLVYVGGLHLEGYEDDRGRTILRYDEGSPIFYDTGSGYCIADIDLPRLYTLNDKVDYFKPKYFLAARPINSDGDLRLKLGEGSVTGRYLHACSEEIFEDFKFNVNAKWINNYYDYEDHYEGCFTLELEFHDCVKFCENGIGYLPIADDFGNPVIKFMDFIIEGNYVWSCFIYHDLVNYALSKFSMYIEYEQCYYKVDGSTSSFKWTLN